MKSVKKLGEWIQLVVHFFYMNRSILTKARKKIVWSWFICACTVTLVSLYVRCVHTLMLGFSEKVKIGEIQLFYRDDCCYFCKPITDTLFYFFFGHWTICITLHIIKNTILLLIFLYYCFWTIKHWNMMF